MWQKRNALVTALFILFELATAQGNNINFSRRNLVLPNHGIPAPRPAPAEVQILEVPTTAAAIVTEPPPMTTLAPIITTRRAANLQLMGAPRPQPNLQKTLESRQTTTILPISDAEILEPAREPFEEVVSSTAATINSEPDPGYFVSKDLFTEDSEVVSSTVPPLEKEEEEVPIPTELPVSIEMPDSTELPASSELLISTEPPTTTELPITTTEILLTTSLHIEDSVPLITTLSPSRQKPIVAIPSSRPLLVRPSQPTQRPIIMGRSPIIEGDDSGVADAEVTPLSKPTPNPVASYDNGHHFEIVHRENWYPLATTTNIAIYQGPSTMVCTDVDSYYALKNECETFVECTRQVATTYMCPDGLFFNTKTVWPHYPCVYPSEVECVGNKHEPKSSGECLRQYGFFPLPRGGDCGKYLMCQEGKATIMDCPPGLAFNPEKDSCDWPINVPSCEPDDLKGFDCPEPLHAEDGSLSDLITHFSFHNSCTQYIACQLGHPRLLSCDLGYSYDPRLNFCARTEDVPGCSHIDT